MTTTEAINILDQAASIAALPRRDHVAVQQAIEVLKKLVGEVKEAENG
jgi:hypothetical protein